MRLATRQAAQSYTPTGSDNMVYNNKKYQGIQCTNVFKNQGSIGDSLTILWAEVINILENTSTVAHNTNMQSHTHPKDEVR